MTNTYKASEFIYHLSGRLAQATGWSFFADLRAEAYQALWAEFLKGGETR